MPWAHRTLLHSSFPLALRAPCKLSASSSPVRPAPPRSKRDVEHCCIWRKSPRLTVRVLEVVKGHRDGYISTEAQGPDECERKGLTHAAWADVERIKPAQNTAGATSRWNAHRILIRK
ncbi:hypothetical protein B0H11DRAFT_1907985 [Mycena galericulata]|nr:hypothetical protein B0H11DRAFT_1907985 [Mycena galericulata]